MNAMSLYVDKASSSSSSLRAHACLRSLSFLDAAFHYGLDSGTKTTTAATATDLLDISCEGVNCSSLLGCTLYGAGRGDSPSTDADSGTWTTLDGGGFNATTTTTTTKQKRLYKTELCRSWEESGKCRYASKCQFAHGVEELRSVNRHPKFKTEVCCTFVTEGTCPYGRRCRFIHKNVPITAVGKQIFDPSLHSSSYRESFISSANSITASSRRLPVFVMLARGEEVSSSSSSSSDVDC